ncbi:hypothetical protein E2C01_003135 [Portunus trituberculatus]|uniref:Uncharacterized protein n=1 Tax=Portunus trituberculatus TaxID=210409 RepID=A0A5B7CN64_PORTR|nr:hypothetical protein [Portunus trituberculatus]
MRTFFCHMSNQTSTTNTTMQLTCLVDEQPGIPVGQHCLGQAGHDTRQSHKVTGSPPVQSLFTRDKGCRSHLLFTGYDGNRVDNTRIEGGESSAHDALEYSKGRSAPGHIAEWHDMRVMELTHIHALWPGWAGRLQGTTSGALLVRKWQKMFSFFIIVLDNQHHNF